MQRKAVRLRLLFAMHIVSAEKALYRKNRMPQLRKIASKLLNFFRFCQKTEKSLDTNPLFGVKYKRL